MLTTKICACKPVLLENVDEGHGVPIDEPSIQNIPSGQISPYISPIGWELGDPDVQ